MLARDLMDELEARDAKFSLGGVKSKIGGHVGGGKLGQSFDHVVHGAERAGSIADGLSSVAAFGQQTGAFPPPDFRKRDAYDDEFDFDLYARDAEAEADAEAEPEYDGDFDFDLFAREAEAEPEAEFDEGYDFDLYAREAEPEADYEESLYDLYE